MNMSRTVWSGLRSAWSEATDNSCVQIQQRCFVDLWVRLSETVNRLRKTRLCDVIPDRVIIWSYLYSTQRLPEHRSGFIKEREERKEGKVWKKCIERKARRTKKNKQNKKERSKLKLKERICKKDEKRSTKGEKKKKGSKAERKMWEQIIGRWEGKKGIKKKWCFLIKLRNPVLPPAEE